MVNARTTRTTLIRFVRLPSSMRGTVWESPGQTERTRGRSYTDKVTRFIRKRPTYRYNRIKTLPKSPWSTIPKQRPRKIVYKKGFAHSGFPPHVVPSPNPIPPEAIQSRSITLTTISVTFAKETLDGRGSDSSSILLRIVKRILRDRAVLIVFSPRTPLWIRLAVVKKSIAVKILEKRVIKLDRAIRLKSGILSAVTVVVERTI